MDHEEDETKVNSTTGDGDENADVKVDGKGEERVDEAAVTRSRGGYTVKNKPEGLYGKFRQCSKYNRRLCLQLHGSIQL